MFTNVATPRLRVIKQKQVEPACAADDDNFTPRQYGVELSADQWQPWDPLDLSPQYLAVCCIQHGMHTPHAIVCIISIKKLPANQSLSSTFALNHCSLHHYF